MSGLDMKVGEIKDNSVRKIAKAAIVDNQPLSGIDHLEGVRCIKWLNKGSGLIYFDIVQIFFLHSLELRDSCRYPRQVMFYGIF